MEHQQNKFPDLKRERKKVHLLISETLYRGTSYVFEIEGDPEQLRTLVAGEGRFPGHHSLFNDFMSGHDDMVYNDMEDHDGTTDWDVEDGPHVASVEPNYRAVATKDGWEIKEVGR